MNAFLILTCAVIVWLNRGRYDPSIPFLTLLYLKWVHAAVRNKSVLTELSARLLKLLPWVFSLLFLIRNELLYVDPRFAPIGTCIRTLPILGMAVYTWGGRARNFSFALFLVPLVIALVISSSPHIDVFQSNKLAVDFFLNGLNPYSASYPEIYKSEFDYRPGFLYWPGALYLQTLSQLIFRDIRVILLLAWAGGGFFIRGRGLLLVSWLTLPFLAFGLEQAWLDPLIAFGGALTLYAIRTKKLGLWVVGVVLAASVKQYGFMIGLFSILYYALEFGIPAMRKSFWMMAGLFLLLMAPMVLWNPHDFFQMTILTHTSAKIRPDALNFTAFLLKVSGCELPGLVQFAFALCGLVLAVYHVIYNRAKRQLRVVPEAWAIFFGFSVFFGKFAFCNYFWLLISFWILAESEGDDKISAAPENLQPSSEGHPDHKSRFA